MNRSSPLNLLLILVVTFLVEGCWGIAEQGSNEPLPTFSPSPLLATPTVSVDHAWQACKSGGELSYEEAIALRPEFVLDQTFAWMLQECQLKETIGWVAWWWSESDTDHKIVPNKNRVAVYMYNPFAGLSKDLSGSPDMYLAYFTDEEVAQFRVGQGIKFGGDLRLVDNKVSVVNTEYTSLENEQTVSRPTADELKDLEIRLDRSNCYGSCPAYTLTITSDGKVTFEGRNDTRVKGMATTTIDKAKLEELVTEIRKADFFNLAERYDEPMHNPKYELTVRLNGMCKTVTDWASGPRRLSILQRRIDQIVNSGQWRCTAPCL